VRENKHETAVRPIQRTRESAPATRNCRPASRSAAHSAALAATAAHEPRPAVKPDGRRRYRTSARGNAPFGRMLRSSQAAGSRIPRPLSGGDSPRRSRMSQNRHTGVPGPAAGGGRPVPAERISLAHWPDNGGSPPAVATAEPPRDKPNCNSGRAGAGDRMAVDNLSTDRCGDPAATAGR
jgi:hypothetical protein